jgi:hypothetical protein
MLIRSKPIPLPVHPIERMAEIKRRKRECDRKRTEADRGIRREQVAASHSAIQAAARDAEWVAWLKQRNLDLIQDTRDA